jgi:hypothetical protein
MVCAPTVGGMSGAADGVGWEPETLCMWSIPSGLEGGFGGLHFETKSLFYISMASARAFEYRM